MNTDVLSLIGQLSDQQLIAQVKLLAQRELESTAALIAHLVVLDERGLYRGEGCSSTFTYCTEVLHLSEHAAYGRIEAVRAARKFPIILKLLADGSVNLTTVTLLAPHLTLENHVELLEAAKHQRKRRVEEIVAAARPQSAVPSSVRRLPAPNRTPTCAPESDALQLESGNELQLMTLTAPGRPAVITPLAPERYKVQFTASAETHAKLMQAQDMLRSQIPDGNLGEIIDRALTVLLRNLAKQKFAATERPRKGIRERITDRPEGSRDHIPRSRHIPAAVKRAVWRRDGGQCSFVAQNGCRCSARALLEFHHVAPHAAGGEPTVENIQLRCRAHNAYEAELYFGRDHYLGIRSNRRGGPDARPPVATLSTRAGPSSKPLVQPFCTPSHHEQYGLAVVSHKKRVSRDTYG